MGGRGDGYRVHVWVGGVMGTPCAHVWVEGVIGIMWSCVGGRVMGMQSCVGGRVDGYHVFVCGWEG